MYRRAEVSRSTTTRRPSGSALQQVDRPDEVPLERLTCLLVDQRHGERLLDGDHLGTSAELLAEDGEHARGEVEQALLRLLLAEAERPVLALELPERCEVTLDVGATGWRRG